MKLIYAQWMHIQLNARPTEPKLADTNRTGINLTDINLTDTNLTDTNLTEHARAARVQ
jgi:uncharacterized protein YjbI with pentapeptide repeats